MRAVCADFEAELVEFNDEANHVHLLVDFPPKIALSGWSTASRASRPAVCGRSSPTSSTTTGAQRLWSGSYFAGSVGGAPLNIVQQYTEQQNRPVQGTTRPPAGLPARAFTTALKGGALARKPVAAGTGRSGPDDDQADDPDQHRHDRHHRDQAGARPGPEIAVGTERPVDQRGATAGGEQQPETQRGTDRGDQPRAVDHHLEHASGGERADGE